MNSLILKLKIAAKALLFPAGTPVAVSPPTPAPVVLESPPAPGDSFPATIDMIASQIDDGDKFSSQIVHLKQLADAGYRASYNGSVVRVVESELSAVRTETRHAPVVMDFGCWSGTTSRYISDVLCVGCVGAEIDQLCLEFGRRYLQNNLVSFLDVTLTGIQCEDNSFDVVLANAVFANMFPALHEPMLRELIRVTKPGGSLIVIDSNNPDSPEVQARLRHLYGLLEGPGGSYLAARRAFIDSLAPDTAPNDEAALATCYCTRAEIGEYLGEARGPTPFDPHSLVAPYALSAPIAAPSTITDHKMYARVMTEAGFSVSCGPGYPALSAVTTEASFVLVGHKPLA